MRTPRSEKLVGRRMNSFVAFGFLVSRTEKERVDMHSPRARRDDNGRELPKQGKEQGRQTQADWAPVMGGRDRAETPPTLLRFGKNQAGGEAQPPTCA